MLFLSSEKQDNFNKKCLVNASSKTFYFFGTGVWEKNNLVPGVLALGVGRCEIELPV